METPTPTETREPTPTVGPTPTPLPTDTPEPIEEPTEEPVSGPGEDELVLTDAQLATLDALDSYRRAALREVLETAAQICEEQEPALRAGWYESAALEGGEVEAESGRVRLVADGSLVGVYRIDCSAVVAEVVTE